MAQESSMVAKQECKLAQGECKLAQDECRRLEVIVVGTESATPQKQAPGSAGGTIISSTPTGEPSTPQNSMGQQGSSSELRPPGSTSSMASEKSTEEEVRRLSERGVELNARQSKHRLTQTIRRAKRFSSDF